MNACQALLAECPVRIMHTPSVCARMRTVVPNVAGRERSDGKILLSTLVIDNDGAYLLGSRAW